jgi:hypothetical protein
VGDNHPFESREEMIEGSGDYRSVTRIREIVPSQCGKTPENELNAFVASRLDFYLIKF